MGTSSSTTLGAKSTCADVLTFLKTERGLDIDLTGHVVILTGANAGLGLRLTEELFKLGATIIMACRSTEKANKARDEILGTVKSVTSTTDLMSQSGTGELIVMELDLADLSSVRNFVENFLALASDESEKKVETVASAAADEVVDEAADDEAVEGKEADDADDAEPEEKIDDTAAEEKSKSASASVKSMKLSALILNAGIMALKEFSVTKDDIEMQFGTNFVGHFYLTQLLVRRGAFRAAELSGGDSGGFAPRIVSLSSSAHSYAPKPLTDYIDKLCNTQSGLPTKEDYGAWPNYGLSKAADMILAREAHVRYYKEHGIACASLHPGAIVTGLWQNIGGVAKAVVQATMAKSVDQGTATMLYVSLLPSDELGGRYFQDCRAAEDKVRKDVAECGTKTLEAGQTYDALLWDTTEELLREKGFLE